MSKRVQILLAARSEIAEVRRYYESESFGLGDLFLHDVDGILKNISDFPLMYPERIGSIRRALLKRFPYAIFYRNNSIESIVIGVRSTKRNPSVVEKF